MTISQLQVSNSILELIRYALVGVISNSTIYLVYLIITYFGVNSKIAMTLLYFIGLSIAFIGNSKWTFAGHKNSIQVVVRYLLTYSLSYLVNLSILIIFVDRLGYAHQLVQGSAILLIAVLHFILFKHFVFNKKINA